MPSSRPCLFGCVTKGVTIHCFPNPLSLKLPKIWVELGGEQLKNLSPEEIYPRIKVCDKHFAEHHRNRNNRLYALAIPTLHLPLKRIETRRYSSDVETLVMRNETRRYSSNVETPQFETLAVSVPIKNVFHVELNRPKQMNAFNKTMWKELGACFSSLNDNPECRVVVLSGQGKHFTAGIDFNSLLTETSVAEDFDDIARKAKVLNTLIGYCQDGITALEDCIKPVLAVVHNACVGAGVDLITAADMRYCTEEAWFQVKEVDLGLAADVGTLQRLPKVVGNTSTVREWCFTGRKVQSKEASEVGLVSRVFPDRDSALKQVLEIAQTIASKSPVAVQVTKKSLVYSQSRPTRDGLEHIKLINQAMLQSEDLKKAAMATATKTETEFENL